MGEIYNNMQVTEFFRRYRQQQVKKPDIILLNAHLPDTTGEALCRYFHRHWQKTPVIFLMNTLHWPTLSRLLNTSAKGFLVKDACHWCPDAIKTVYSGRTFLQPDLARELLQHRSIWLLEKLSSKEYDVVMLLVKNKTYEEISELMHLSIKTIYNLKMSAFRKMEVQTLTQLEFAVSESILTTP